MSIAYEIVMSGADVTLAIEAIQPAKKLKFHNGIATVVYDRIPNFDGLDIQILDIQTRITGGSNV